MFDFERPNIEVSEISEDKKYGKFVVKPLERGYGITLGNSLRRIMLSSLPGAAVSQIKIEGVLHEFSSIPGVKEDVSEIIMNIKSLAIRNNSDTNEPKTAYIEYEGEGVVTAADIKADSDIVIMNPDQVIATLNGGTNCKLYMELTITKDGQLIAARLHGQEIDPQGRYRIATLDYVAQGNDQLSAFKRKTDVHEPGGKENDSRFVIERYFQEKASKGEQVDARREGRIVIQ